MKYQATGNPDQVILLDGSNNGNGKLIHPQSHFWPTYIKYVAEGGEVRPVKPDDFSEWVDGQWVENAAERESVEALAFLAETDSPRAIDEVIDFIVNGTPLSEFLINRHSDRKVARGKVKK